jgi:hypothetical protein
MADVMSILSANYKAAGLSHPSNTPYVAVDSKLYQGTWSGTYADKKTFKITVSDVTGFRAQVKYQSGTTVKYASVLIKDKSFRIGDTKFTLAHAATATKAATAQIKNVLTDPRTGSTYLDTATATHS